MKGTDERERKRERERERERERKREEEREGEGEVVDAYEAGWPTKKKDGGKDLSLAREKVCV